MVLMTRIHHSYIVHRTQHGPYDTDSPQLHCTQDLIVNISNFVSTLLVYIWAVGVSGVSVVSEVIFM